jgi:hypothetical protein
VYSYWRFAGKGGNGILLSWRFRADGVEIEEMTTESNQDMQYQRRRRHFRGYRRVKVVLLAVGIAGLFLGLFLLCWYAMSGNVKLFNIGIIYVLVSLIVIGLRGIIVYLGRSQNE